MKNEVRFLGLDVHAETIAVAIAEPDDDVRSLGTTTNRVESGGPLIVESAISLTWSQTSDAKFVNYLF